MSRLPSFFLVGAPRCGTTTLNEVLDAHPETFTSANKEPWFYAVSERSEPFTGPGDGQGVRNRSEYEALFAGSDAAVAVGEASTLYLSSDHAAERIAADVPDARIVVTLRDPVQRAFSNFSQHTWQARETLGFDEALAAGPGRVASGWAPFWDYEALSRYGAQLDRWFRVFDREQIHVILFDDLDSRRSELLSDLYRHVGVDPSFRPP
ncbi:MAG: sulfotransferase, partial [Acidimicrobiia bacterium]|nr:sulfotransferase [Acidimicrobiia bacterium]